MGIVNIKYMRTFDPKLLEIGSEVPNYGDYPAVSIDDFFAKTFTQQLDHFDYQDDRTFEQRYWVNTKYF